MSIYGLMCHDLTVVYPGSATDRYGNVGKSWASGTRLEVRGRITQRRREENRDGRETGVTEWVVYLPPGTPVSTLDRIEWEGLAFEVNGVPHRAFGRHQEHHIELHVDRVEG